MTLWRFLLSPGCCILTTNWPVWYLVILLQVSTISRWRWFVHGECEHLIIPKNVVFFFPVKFRVGPIVCQPFLTMIHETWWLAQCLDIRYLLCPQDLPVKHLEKFIRSKFSLDATHKVRYECSALPAPVSALAGASAAAMTSTILAHVRFHVYQ